MMRMKEAALWRTELTTSSGAPPRSVCGPRRSPGSVGTCGGGSGSDSGASSSSSSRMTCCWWGRGGNTHPAAAAPVISTRGCCWDPEPHPDRWTLWFWFGYSALSLMAFCGVIDATSPDQVEAPWQPSLVRDRSPERSDCDCFPTLFLPV